MYKNKESHNDIANLVIIQSTPFCNLDCTYCYLPNRDSKEKISFETIDNIARVVFSTPNLSEKVTVLWHAGEPLVVSRDFYERAHDILSSKVPKNVDLHYNFQTNGTLINDSWCVFFKRDNIRVNISLDGPEFIHNANRVTRSGKGSFKKVMKGIEYLQKNDIKFGVLAVVTRASIDYPNEIFEFFYKNGIYKIGFNIEELEGVHKVSSLNNRDLDSKVFKFFETLQNLSDKNKAIHIRELEDMMVRVRNGSWIKRADNEPLRIVSFDYSGNVSTFSPELLSNKHHLYGDFTFGNVKNMKNLGDVFTNEKFLRVNEDITIGRDMCRNQCEYYDVCGGGSPSNKLYENNTFRSTETLSYRLHEQVVGEAVLLHLENKHLVRKSELVEIKT
jgi:uncharacterized protein